MDQASLAELSIEAAEKSARPLTIRLGKKVRPWLNRVIAHYSVVSNDPVLDAARFDWTLDLERHWQAIRSEAERILRHQEAVPPLEEISPDHARIAAGGKWRSFFLYGYGYRVPGNCDRAPETTKLVAGVPKLNSAFFSILAPGCHIPRHRGVTKGIMTCHLGLIVPDRAERCRMRVEDKVVQWQAGKCLIFDDSQEHEVWNDTDQTRIVLLIQFARPARFPGNFLAALSLAAVRRTAFVQDARRNLLSWDTAFSRAERET